MLYKMSNVTCVSLFLLVCRFPTELNVGEVSAQVFWNLFSSDLQDMLKGGMYH